MAQALQSNLLIQSVGTSIKNHKGEAIGEIVEIVTGQEGDIIQYVILQSNNLHGKGNRFFAVPASTSLIKITTGGKIILQADKEKLQRARGITFDQCPKPTFHYEPSIFELYQYNRPKKRNRC